MFRLWMEISFIASFVKRVLIDLSHFPFVFPVACRMDIIYTRFIIRGGMVVMGM